jgi:hypothetical protein
MFVVTIKGGLGNQLFQYNFAKYLQKQYGITLCLTSRKTKGSSVDEEIAEEQTY